MYLFNPSCTEYVHFECWHFDKGASSQIDDVLADSMARMTVWPVRGNFSQSEGVFANELVVRLGWADELLINQMAF